MSHTSCLTPDWSNPLPGPRFCAFALCCPLTSALTLRPSASAGSFLRHTSVPSSRPKTPAGEVHTPSLISWDTLNPQTGEDQQPFPPTLLLLPHRPHHHQQLLQQRESLPLQKRSLPQIGYRSSRLSKRSFGSFAPLCSRGMRWPECPMRQEREVVV